MSPRVLAALAVADFRERVRRPAYAVILLTAVGLGWLAVPSTTSHWVIVSLGDYRGVYDSAYVGAVTALAGALWLSMGGFYVVRTAIARDGASGVGQLLAATPLRTTGYLFGKFLSNLLVLASMAGALAVTALVMLVARGESTGVDPVALLTPFVLFTLPVLAVTSACAVLFETVRPLSGGLGNVAWFFLALLGMIAGQSPSAPLGGLGVHPFAASVHADMVAEHLPASELGLGLMYLDDPPRTFVWSGLDVGWGFAAERLLLALIAAAVVTLPALWFGRFDPARDGRPDPARDGRYDQARGRRRHDTPGFMPDERGVPADARPPRAAFSDFASFARRGRAGSPHRYGARDTAFAGRVTTVVRPGNTAWPLLSGELRILVRGLSPWWWAGLAVLTGAGLLVPREIATGPLLLAACVWPVLVWSRLGTQAHENDVTTLLGAYPGVRRRVLAEWAAGLLLTAPAGLVPALRMALAADWPGVAAWTAGMVFIPSLALTLGVLGRNHRLFQALYLSLWWAVVNGIAALDYIGAVRDGGHPAGHPLAVTAASAILLALTFAVVGARHARR